MHSGYITKFVIGCKIYIFQKFFLRSSTFSPPLSLIDELIIDAELDIPESTLLPLRYYSFLRMCH